MRNLTQLIEDTESEDVLLASLFQALGEQEQLETQTDEDACTYIKSNLQTSTEETKTEIIVDVLLAKNRPEVKSDSNREEEKSYKPTITMGKALECIDGLRNYILALNDTTDRDYGMLYWFKGKKIDFR